MTNFAFTRNDDDQDLGGSTKYAPIPEGDYKAMITDSEMKPTRAGTGEYLQLVWEVTDGEHAARRIWDRLNLKNPSEKAVQIAERDLSSIMRALGLQQMQDTEELHYKELLVSVTIRKGDNGFEDSNEIKAYAPLGASAPAPTKEPAAAPGKKPWEQ
jgi:hypothetical protein